MKNLWVWVILGVLLIGLSVAAYFYFRDGDEDKPKKDEKTPEKPSSPTSDNNTWANAKTGDKGRIRELQKFINEAGYTPKLAEDGVWGPKTAEAVMAVFATAEVSNKQWENRGNAADNYKASKGVWAGYPQQGKVWEGPGLQVWEGSKTIVNQ